jgi:membrane protein DedA with SNARE-associated domain
LSSASSDGEPVTLGLVVTPVLQEDAARRLARELGELLRDRYPAVRWELPYVLERLVEPPARLPDLVDALRARLLEENWDLAVCITELPLRLGRRTLVTHASPSHGVALVSLPAVGAIKVAGRLRDAAAVAVGAVLGEPPRQPEAHRRAAAISRRLVELASDARDPADDAVSFLARVISGNARLLMGMIRANRPWRLVARLSHALVGALAAATVALASSDVWRIAAHLDALRLATMMVGVLVLAVAAPIVVHGLWERSRDRRAREQVMLFNVTTLVTLAIGMVALYGVLFVASLAAAGVLIDARLLEQAVVARSSLDEYLRLAWLVSSLATVGGVLGGALESDEAVREAAYAR